jgi:hypothetical protein
MSTQPSSWYAFSDEGTTLLRCAACHAVINLEGPMLDHHARACPRCEVDCAFLNWKGRMLQVVPSHTPDVIRRALRFVQQDLDELEYAELLVALEGVMDALHVPSLTERCT